MTRPDGRQPDALRPVTITKNFTMHAEGSVLITCGNTKVICNATVEEKVPPFLKDTGLGWVTAEYAMLPRATNTRSPRDISKLKLNGRSAEIQRLIGRALRAVVDRKALGERQIVVDCDVIQADGGTRCASITGGFGYDPLFYVREFDCTFGELPQAVKNHISHRARALEKLKAALEKHLKTTGESANADK